jgi:hypothetical protein
MSKQIQLILPSNVTDILGHINIRSDYKTELNPSILLSREANHKIAVNNVVYPLSYIKPKGPLARQDNRFFIVCDLTADNHSLGSGHPAGAIYGFVPDDSLTQSQLINNNQALHASSSKHVLDFIKVNKLGPLRDISIRVVDADNQLVHFTSGKVIVTLELTS